uniref:UDP glucuronosyltransferase 5 family, polypeptide D1 n=1 Tax=Haplochromis burtoni TaxID=8153 RepID=A0A3Q2W219_HAPBU
MQSALVMCLAIVLGSTSTRSSFTLLLVFPVDGSHWINMNIIIEELNSRGHEVTVVRPNDTWYIKSESPDYKTITIKFSNGFNKEHFEAFVMETLTMRRQGASLWTRLSMEHDLVKQLYQMHVKVLEMVEGMFEDTKLMQSLRDAKYDLVLTDPTIGTGVLMAHRLGLPLVFNVRWTIQGEGHLAIAPSPLSYIPIPGTELTDKMTFIQRVQNMLYFFFTCFQIWYVTEPNYKPFVHRHFGSDVHYMELFQSADIWLMRNDFTFEFPRPTMPNVVYMSGFQCKPSKPLPKELEDFVQSSGEHGAIVMTLGSVVKKLPEDIVTRNTFPTVLNEFPEITSTCWPFCLHFAVHIIPKHLNWV